MKNLLTIVVPVLNEEKNIVRLLDQLAAKVKTQNEILVIYDSKDDPTIKVVNKYLKNHKDLNLSLIKNSIGRKKGVMNAIKTGFAKAKGDAILVLMADLSDDLTIIDKMHGKILEGYDIVCGSRYMKDGKKIGGPFLKTVLSKAAGLSLNILGIPTHDSTNAFKMYRKKLLNNISVESTGGFEYSLEIITKAYQMGYRITEIPSTWIDRETGKSKFKLLKWLPSYIKWYMRALTTCIDKVDVPENLYYFFILVLTLIFELSTIGSQIRTKIPISSTLDFSWNTDITERFLHGFIAGKDFIFTYGPLYQLIYSLPSLLLRLPSYLSYAYIPLVTTLLLFIILIIIAKLICEDKKDKIFFFSFLLFIAGLVAYPSPDIIKILLPFVFALTWSEYLFKKGSLRPLILIAVLPTVFGAFSYDLFIYCLIISFILSLIEFFNKGKLLNTIIPLICIVLYQLLFSFIFSGGLNYIYYSVQTSLSFIGNLTTKWSFGDSGLTIIFPIVLIFLLIYLLASKHRISHEKVVIFLVMSLVSLVELQTAFVRSDSGHIVRAIYPCIITCFTILYYIAGKNSKLLLLGLFLFVVIPYKPVFTLSVGDIKLALNPIKTKPSFLSVYDVNGKYSLNNKDIAYLTNFISYHRDNVFVFPYDSYLLDISGTTYNSFPLQYYSSSVDMEINSQKIMQRSPPGYIILGIDGKSVLDLDQTPNLTRNPVIFKWILNNYSADIVSDDYLILKFNSKSKQVSRPRDCSLYGLTFKSSGKFYNLADTLTQLIKRDIFYLDYNNNIIRLPEFKIGMEYLIFDGYKNSLEISKLFSQKIDFTRGYVKNLDNQKITVIKYSLFDFKKNIIKLSGRDVKITCYN